MTFMEKYMINDKKEYSLNYGGKEVTVETSRLAKQADGSVLVTCNDTQVLVTVCSAHSVKDGQDFFPLLVEYTEKFYSAGKFLGGFLKREGRPSTQETLNARLIDRPLRPLFPKGYMFDTVVSCTVMSYGKDGDPEVLAGLGASAALSISDIPFAGPIGTCKVGKIDGKLVLNPDADQWENSSMEVSVAGSKDAILMVEGEADILPEEEVLEGIKFAHDSIKEYCALIAKMQADLGKTKREFISSASNTQLENKVKELYTDKARACLNIVDKMERQAAVREFESFVSNELQDSYDDFGLAESCSFSKEAYKAVDGLLYDLMRTDILKEGRRIGGRALDQVRPIETETNCLKTPHGSSLFTRGETQVMACATIGGSSGEQMSDRIVGTSYANFYLHYNFPPYSVGEARGVRGVGRRELGHGNLAERAVKAVMPHADDFPYTARVVCEVLESNGSSSMGSVCSASMALMDAGVTLKAPVAGIAMGLIKEDDQYVILSDILGDEDHLGDMDFKVAGTSEGVTAIQMDIKITGITFDIMTKAFSQAKEGRNHILQEMGKTISVTRPEFKQGVPRIFTFNIPTDKIGALIGPGGKNIKKLQEDYPVTIEVTDDGLVKVLGTDKEKIAECIDLAQLQITGPVVGKDYDAVVVSIKDYGTFVDIAPGVSGLVHISEIAEDRVSDVREYLTEDDKVKVKVVDVDRMGRIKLSIKAVAPIAKKE
jgi:polyribonucleotide nucleotidyltransferase